MQMSTSCTPSTLVALSLLFNNVLGSSRIVYKPAKTNNVHIWITDG
jgi:hypothetical protein